MRDFFYNLMNFTCDILRLTRVLWYQIKIQRFRKIQYEEKCNPLFILGNGPSLSKIKEEITDRSNVDLCCVNFSVLTDIFYDLKPDVLIFADPCFFNDVADTQLKHKVDEVYKSITTKINWSINIQIPYNVSDTFFRICSSNKNVTITYYTTCDWKTSCNIAKKIKLSLFKRSIICPSVQNVVVGAIYNAINRGYKDIYLYGVEHSWLKYTYINNKNENCFVDEHYYGNTERVWKHADGTPIPLHELLSMLANTFRSYFELKEYADYLGDVRIINKTPGSFIDAFDRE